MKVKAVNMLINGKRSSKGDASKMQRVKEIEVYPPSYIAGNKRDTVAMVITFTDNSSVIVECKKAHIWA